MLITSLVTSKFLDNEKYINFTIAFYQVSNGLRTGIHELMKYEDWDNNAYPIMQVYRKDKKQMLVALTAHKIKLEKEKFSRVQTRLLDLAKKQNLSILQYDDNALTHHKKYSRWIKK